MKQFITPFLIAALATSAWAGGTAEDRGKCKTFSKRYISSARISIGVPLCYQTNRSCYGVVRGFGNPQCSQNCGFQEAWAGTQGKGTYGYISQNICSRGEQIDDLTLELLSGGTPGTTGGNGNIEESLLEYNSFSVDPATHSILVKNLNGKLYLGKGNGFMSTLKLTVWLPADTGETEDTVVDANQVVADFSITATDQGAKIAGSLAGQLAKQVTTTNTAVDVTASVTAGQLSVAIPASINLESLAVRVENDGAPDRNQRRTAALDETQTAIDARQVVLNVFPNPAADVVNLEFANNHAAGATTVQLFDAAGRKLADVFSGTLEKAQLQRISVNLASYPSQTYFLLVTSGDRQLLRQIVKQ